MTRRLVVLILVGLAVSVLQPPARAQVIIREVREVQVADRPQDPAAPDAVIEEEAIVVAAPAVNFVVNDAQFDMWVFGSPRTAGGGRSKLEALLDLSVDEVSRECKLADSSRQKLILAGKGDIKRFFDKVEEKRKKFESMKNDQNKIGELYQELVPLQSAVNSGLFGDGSLYSKTLRRVLGDYDDARYQETLRAKREFHYRAKVELVVAQLDQTLGLSDRQRRTLVDTIIRETRPPERYGQYAYYLILYQAGKVHRDKLRPLFEPKQWEFFQRQLDQMRGIEQFLRTQGMLPAKDEAREVADAFRDALRAPAAEPDKLPSDVFAGDADKGKRP